jgi:cation diffusion facilitator CzcD-associated flavoprotein CzcO
MMLTNQSKHTVQFSDLAWDASEPEFPQAWMVGRYLERYAKRYGITNIRLRHRVILAELLQDGGWSVTVHSDIDSIDISERFDYLLIAAGFFGGPLIDQALVPRELPWVHSSEYRDLVQLLGKGAKSGDGGKILVVGGQMSGVEIAGTIAGQISSHTHSPEPTDIMKPEKYTVHHVIQRPIWVFPLFTSPKVRGIRVLGHVEDANDLRSPT